MYVYDPYNYRVRWSCSDNDYIATCDEFPSLSWLEHTADGAIIGIRKLVREVVADMED